MKWLLTCEEVGHRYIDGGVIGALCLRCNHRLGVAALIERRMKMAKRSKAHPGFKAVEAKIAKQPGVKDAGAVLASKTREASRSAKKANPRLKRVKG